MKEGQPQGAEHIRNLLLFGQPEPPRVVLLQEQAEAIEYAATMSNIPPYLDALPRSDGRPYAIYDVPHTKPLIPKRELIKGTFNGDNTSQADASRNPSVILVSFSDPKNLEQNVRQTNRGMDRVERFGHLLEFIADCERKLADGVTPYLSVKKVDEEGQLDIDAVKITPEDIEKLKAVAKSFFDDELAKEPFTKEIATIKIERVTLQKDAVLREADNIIFEHQKKKKEDKVEVKFATIENPTNQPTGDSAQKREETEKKALASLTEEELDNRKDEWEPKTVGELVDEYLKLDLPSKSAGSFVRELMERPY